MATASYHCRDHAPGSIGVLFAVGDFNGDGKLDAVVEDVSQMEIPKPTAASAGVLPDNGDGRFSPSFLLRPTHLFGNNK
jgi:hypothetical protein